MPANGGPFPGKHNFGRGESLQQRALGVGDLLTKHSTTFDGAAGVKIWSEALECAQVDIEHGWLHGDLQPSNMLTEHGTVMGVIDFGGLAVGDTACELLVCWTSFGPKGRAAIREFLRPSDAAWRRGRGWALATAIDAYNYYRAMDHPIVAQSEKTLRPVITETC